MKTRVRTGIIFTVIVLAFVIPGFRIPWLPLVLFGLVGLAAALELQHALSRKVEHISLFTMLAASLYQFWPLVTLLSYRMLRPNWQLLPKSGPAIDARWQTDYLWLVGLALAFTALVTVISIFLIAVLKLIRYGNEALPAVGAETACFLWIAAPFAVVPILLYGVPNGWLWLLLALFAPWISDTAAYYVGVNVGHTPILPQISPKKTLEGTIGGVVGTMLISALFFGIVMGGPEPMRPALGRNIAFGLLAGLVLSLVSQFGDWFASALKRFVRIKDYSNILPGHGGILDRFDGVLFTLPVTLALGFVYYLF
ncbi:MAG: phosphatidate cytidylyltransferase [Bacillota bacterium]|nr:phosphatidate cytidylyltransferase [Bacillota bacterium]